MGMVLVTGGSRGIGRACCAAFAKAGWDVAFCYARDEAGAAETRRLIEACGAGALALRCDVRSEAQVNEMFSALPGLSALVNNAGVSLFSQLQDTSLAQWREVFAVNCEGAFLCTRAAVPLFLRRGGGAIVNISSVSAHRPSPGTASYGAAKAGVDSLTRSLAVEWAPHVRVNSVVVGPVKTELAEMHYGDSDGIAAVDATVPMGRMADPVDVGHAVSFLASPLARFITGAELLVHGGGERPAFLDASTANKG